MPYNEWVIIPGAIPGYSDETGHGTGVASKVCGQRAGVAKLTTIIPVKVNTQNVLSWTSLWTRTLNDIRDRQRTNRGASSGKTVINFSITYPGDSSISYEVDQVKPILANIMALGVVIVVAAGNDREAGGMAVSHAPAVWAGRDFPIIVVSSVDRTFQLSEFSQYGPQTAVWAIGERNVIASTDGRNFFKFNVDGTSFGKSALPSLTVPFAILRLVVELTKA